MDLDSAITLVLVVLMALGPLLSAVLIVLFVRQSKKLERLTIKLDEIEKHADDAAKENVKQIGEELSKQRRMISESLSGVNDNVTRALSQINKSK